MSQNARHLRVSKYAWVSHSGDREEKVSLVHERNSERQRGTEGKRRRKKTAAKKGAPVLNFTSRPDCALARLLSTTLKKERANRRERESSRRGGGTGSGREGRRQGKTMGEKQPATVISRTRGLASCFLTYRISLRQWRKKTEEGGGGEKKVDKKKREVLSRESAIASARVNHALIESL